MQMKEKGSEEVQTEIEDGKGNIIAMMCFIIILAIQLSYNLVIDDWFISHLAKSE